MKIDDSVKDISGIYKIVNKINGKYYIGSAKNFRVRYRCHKSLLNRNKHYSKHLQNSWNKHGSENFEFIVLEYVDLDKYIEREQYWIDFYQATNDEFGYNLAKFAGSQLGYRHTEETKLKLKRSSSGRSPTPETREKLRLALIGKPRPEEVKLKIGKSNKGKVRSAETKQKIRDINLGKTYSNETKAKVAEAGIKNTYKITTPDNEELVVKNLKEFCRNYNLKSGALYNIANKKNNFKHHHGYKIEIIN